MDDRRILILRLSAVGDVVRTLPAVRALRKLLPSSRIAWLVEEPSKGFLESQPEVDEVLLFPRRRWSDGIRSPWTVARTFGEMLQFVRRLRKQRFDLVLDFHGIMKSGLISFLSGAPVRIGYDRRSSKEGNFLFSNVKVSLPPGKMSRYQRNLELLKGIGLEVMYPEQGLHIPSGDRVYVEVFLNRVTYPLPRPWIAIHPGTSNRTSYKRWKPERYSQLADRLVRELGSTIIFTWGPGEMTWAEKIQKMMTEPSLLGPRTDSLTQLGELFRRCDLYLGGDTGPMHIASMVGTPVVAIFGPTDPVVNEPFGAHRKVRKDVGCNPCRERSCRETLCLDEVTVEEVLAAAKEMLSYKGRSMDSPEDGAREQ
jgi:lipopolysaccharide heptosyltransferase I